ncbi:MULTISPECIES: hypothetical protein [unclassified Luteimonas]|uniref:hypothetical protein n=1 Tax=Lysobacteraceae TaxID=32033 RepID=UPI0019D71109|nr:MULTISPECIES: hypothetical protein [unclassified Luteimonas]MCD9046275.1 hypothetical protein [Luteimonas sp. MHLX1A]
MSASIHTSRALHRVAATLFLGVTAWSSAGAQVRAPEPMPRQVEGTRLQTPPPPPAHVRPALTDPRVRQAQDRLDTRRRVIESDRQHEQRLQTLGATPQARETELAASRLREADARRDAALLREREAAVREARARELVDPPRR